MESFTRTARERGSLGIDFATTYKQQLIRITETTPEGNAQLKYKEHNGTLIRVSELLRDGASRELCVDYYGTVLSDETINRHGKLLPQKRLVDARVKISETYDLWSANNADYDNFDDEYTEQTGVHPDDLPSESLTVFRLSHGSLLIGYHHTWALEVTRRSRRKTIRVTEPPTESPNRLHTMYEIAHETFAETKARYEKGTMFDKLNLDVSRRLRWIERDLKKFRKGLF